MKLNHSPVSGPSSVHGPPTSNPLDKEPIMATTQIRRRIPVFSPCLLGNEKKYVDECLDTVWVSSIGRFIPLFEQGFADFCGVHHAIATNSGTSALHAALLGLGIGPGDEVIVPSLTFVATANVVRYCGATPVFVDSDPVTMTIAPAGIAARITPRTRAIMVVHLYGHPADMDPILAVARQYGLFVVEDAAEAHGALYKGRKVGSLGDIAAFSFFGNKIITTGEGGMVLTNDETLRTKIRILCGQGMDPERRYWYPEVGYNYRMTNVAAAIGLAQLEKIDLQLEKRRWIADRYRSELTHLENSFLNSPQEETWATHAFWAYTIELTGRQRLSRDEMIANLLEDGIETRPAFYPMHTLPPYFDAACSCPVAESLGANGIVLPSHLVLDDDDISFIARRLAHHCQA